MNKIVIYTSRYGSTEKYAQWIGEALGCSAKKQVDVSPSELANYDLIIYGGGLYAGGISGFKKFLAKLSKVNKQQKLVLFMVGLTNPEEVDIYKGVADHSIPLEWKDKFQTFALRGDQLFSHMSFLHKTMMRMPKGAAEKKPLEERTKEDIQFLEFFGKDLIFADQEAITPLIAYVQGIKSDT